MAQGLIGHENHGGFALLIAGALIAISGRLALCQMCSISMGPSATQPFMAAPSEQMPAYEVATIKPAEANVPGTPLRAYIQRAFGVSPNIIGSIIGPDWINSARYVIQGMPPDSIRDAMKTMTTVEGAKEIERMQQSLLADRFELKAHFETREMPMYQLVQAKGGSKLKEEPDPTKHQIRMNQSSFGGAAMIHSLIDVLECSPDIGGREVIDQTGLAGVYDILLKWTPLQTAAAPGGGSGSPPSPDVEGASLFTAIEEQLGLKLVPTKGPGQVLVIDHIEQPSAN
jgi:uncharacterized protein (TIGR03435 family)